MGKRVAAHGHNAGVLSADDGDLVDVELIDGSGRFVGISIDTRLPSSEPDASSITPAAACRFKFITPPVWLVLVEPTQA